MGRFFKRDFNIRTSGRINGTGIGNPSQKVMRKTSAWFGHTMTVRDKRDHQVRIDVVRTTKEILPNCSCGWAKRTTYEQWDPILERETLRVAYETDSIMKTMRRNEIRTWVFSQPARQWPEQALLQLAEWALYERRYEDADAWLCFTLHPDWQEPEVTVEELLDLYVCNTCLAHAGISSFDDNWAATPEEERSPLERICLWHASNASIFNQGQKKQVDIDRQTRADKILGFKPRVLETR